MPFPPPGDLSHPGIEPTSPALAGGFFTGKPLYRHISEILQVWFQTTTVERISQSSELHTFVGFPMDIKAVFTLHCSLLICSSIMSEEVTTLIKKVVLYHKKLLTII